MATTGLSWRSGARRPGWGRAFAAAAPGLVGAPLAAGQGSITFDHQVIDGTNTGDCKELGDIDGDGLPDAVLGGVNGLWWYKSPAWTRTLIATPATEFSTDMQLADMDGDGDLDVVVPDGGNGRLGWFENPRPSGNPATGSWAFHLIGTTPDWIHDVRVVDLNGDGRIDVVTCHHSGYDAWIRLASGGWTHVNISGRAGTGLSVGDIDGDGLPDVVLGPVWLKTPADPVNGTWTERTIATGWPSETASFVSDISGDGRADVVLVPSESSGRLSWFEAPADPLNGAWAEHVVTSAIGYVHAVFVADIDHDGVKDVVFAEQAQSSQKRVGFFSGTPGGALWSLTVLSTSGSHNIRVGDIGGDGDLDIIGANWQGPPLEAWINRLDPVPPPPCPGDWNRDGVASSVDVGAYVNDWALDLSNGQLDADMDGDGRITPGDVAAFVSTWWGTVAAGGCG